MRAPNATALKLSKGLDQIFDMYPFILLPVIFLDQAAEQLRDPQLLIKITNPAVWQDLNGIAPHTITHAARVGLYHPTLTDRLMATLPLLLLLIALIGTIPIARKITAPPFPEINRRTWLISIGVLLTTVTVGHAASELAVRIYFRSHFAYPQQHGMDVIPDSDFGNIALFAWLALLTMHSMWQRGRKLATQLEDVV